MGQSKDIGCSSNSTIAAEVQNIMLDTAEKYGLYENGLHHDLMFPHTDGSYRFWVDEATKLSARTILELACGTGRTSITLAQAGYEVTGIDLSSKMLCHAQSKCVGKNYRIKWIEGDMRSFDLGTQFSLTILGGNSLCHLLDLASVEACLSSVRRHLEPTGKFILSVFVPNPTFLLRHGSHEESFAEYLDPESGEKVVVTHTYEYEPDTQIKRVRLKHRFPKEITEETMLSLRMYFPQELDALLRYNGFRILHKWGDQERKEFGPDSHQQIVVCSKTTAA